MSIPNGAPRARAVLGHAAGLLAALALTAGAALTAAATPAAAATGTTYYVDCSGGADARAGTSPDTAWQSLAKVSATTFQPGDSVLLKSGCTWTGQLWPKGSGTTAEPITVDSYGSGAQPAIAGGGRVADAVKLFNQSSWTIRGIDVSNTAPATGTPGANLADLRGIHVTGDDSQRLGHVLVDGVTVHDVTGEVNWIGGDTADDATGVHFQTGWDRSKKTGGIVFDTTVPDPANPPATPTTLDDITVQHSTISNTSFAGIVVKQYTGDAPSATATGWGTRTSASDAAFAPHTNVSIHDNFISQAGTDYGCNGVYLTDVRHATVDHNVVHHAGTSGIETYFADDVTIQHNEVYGTVKKAGGADFNGIDADKATTAVTLQYNFVHDNGDGILFCQFAFGDVTARYNIVARSSRYPLYLHSDKAATALIHNNTVYNDNGGTSLVYGYGSSLAAHYTLRDNALYSTTAGAALTTSSTITYDTNFYGGATLPIPSGDTHAVKGEARFAAPSVSGPYGTADTGPQLDTALGWAPTAGSALIDAGATVTDNGGVDYRGTSLYHGAPDIGAVEY